MPTPRIVAKVGSVAILILVVTCISYEIFVLHFKHDGYRLEGLANGNQLQRIGLFQNVSSARTTTTTLTLGDEDPPIKVSVQQPTEFRVPVAVDKQRSKEQTSFKLEEKIHVSTSSDFLSQYHGSLEEVVIIEYPKMDFGLLCNVIHQVAAALDFAMAFPHRANQVRVALAVHKSLGDQLRRALDVELLVHTSRHLAELDIDALKQGPEFPELRLHNVEILLDWDDALHRPRALRDKHRVLVTKPSRYMRKHLDEFSFALTFCIRPHRSLRDKANVVVDNFMRENPDEMLISVHRRIFVWCKARSHKPYGPFCQDRKPRWGHWKYYDDDCNVTYSEELMDDVFRAAFHGVSSVDKNYTFFLASDLHDPAGDATFRANGNKVIDIPHVENPEEAEREAKRERARTNTLTEEDKKIKYLGELVKARTGFDMHWDLSMLVDMHAETRAHLSMGAPWSSCDRILTMWRSAYGKAATEAFDAFIAADDNQASTGAGKAVQAFVIHNRSNLAIQTFPSLCYKEFESPRHAEKVLQVFREWWNKDGLSILSSTSSNATIVHVSSGSPSGVDFVMMHL